MMDFRSGRCAVMASALRLKATAHPGLLMACLLYTSDAADEHRDVVVSGGGGG